MITKQQIIRTLMLSPFYFHLTLHERRQVLEAVWRAQRLRTGRRQAPEIPSRGNPGENPSTL